jgi:hypothetical protein
MNDPTGTRRSFLLALGGISTSAWLASSAFDVAAAAEHAAHVATTTPTAFEFLSRADAADVDAIAAQILPSGASPGAREAHVVYFVDRALATFFSDRAPALRTGLADLQSSFRRAHPSNASFAAASSSDQIAFLTSVEHGEFFAAIRFLTILGTFSLSKYGGNYAGAGWKLMGFEDQHVFTPPFGYYDRGYAGYVSQPIKGDA